jgi:hypothetical protein
MITALRHQKVAFELNFSGGNNLCRNRLPLLRLANAFGMLPKLGSGRPLRTTPLKRLTYLMWRRDG